MQVAPSGGQICNKCKRCHVVAQFNPSHGVNFWVRCASGNVCEVYLVFASSFEAWSLDFLKFALGWERATSYSLNWFCYSVKYILNYHLSKINMYNVEIHVFRQINLGNAYWDCTIKFYFRFVLILPHVRSHLTHHIGNNPDQWIPKNKNQFKDAKYLFAPQINVFS